MADTGKVLYALGGPQVHVSMCDKHAIQINMICDDCEEFICSKCVKIYHKDHNWGTISAAASLMRKELLKLLEKIEGEDIEQLDSDIQGVSKQIKENKKICEREISRLQTHYDAIVEELNLIRESIERSLRNCLESKNSEARETRTILKDKKKNILKSVKFLKDYNSGMSDIDLLKSQTELTKLLSRDGADYQGLLFSSTYNNGKASKEVLESLIGNVVDPKQIYVIETDSFQWDVKQIDNLVAINLDTCLLSNNKSQYFDRVKKNGKREQRFREYANSICITDKNKVYFTEKHNKSIAHLSSLGSVSSISSTDPLEPIGIYQTMDGDLLVTLVDTESDKYLPNRRSRRLVRRMTTAGEVVHDYEFQEDGRTRLFTWPVRVTQNGITDICVINWISKSEGELLILSFSGFLKSAYCGHDQTKNFSPTDVVCDPYSNIIVSNSYDSTIHLLNPGGKFMRYLLTNHYVDHPTALSLRQSTFWVGDVNGCVKVFHYKT